MAQIKQKTLVWAVDPNATSLRSYQNEISLLANDLGLAVRPVHILARSEVSIQSPRSKSAIPQRLVARRRLVEEYVASFRADSVGETTILVAPTSKQTDRVKCALDFAHSQGAALVALASHGRTGLSRIFLGSFAEALLSRSDLPVLFLSHREKASRTATRRILFATDFSSVSAQVFFQIIELCRNTPAEVVLFNQIGLAPIVEATLSSAGTLAVLPDNYFSEQRASAEAAANAYMEIAKAARVSVRPLIVNGRGPISDLILEAAKNEEADLIAMASHTGPFEKALLGSVASGVFRSHDLPVLVYGPKCAANVSIPKEIAHVSAS